MSCPFACWLIIALAFATSGGQELCASTVAVPNVAIATALMSAAYVLFIMSLSTVSGCDGGATPIGRSPIFLLCTIPESPLRFQDDRWGE
jgi:hypothetical protein